jgi:hypothetical protein
LELAAAAINGAGGRLGPGQGAAERGAGWLGFNEEEVGTCGRVKDTRLYSRYGGDIEDHVWFEDRWMVASLCDE